MKQENLNLLSELDNITPIDYQNMVEWILFDYLSGRQAREVIEKMYLLEVGDDELQKAKDKIGIGKIQIKEGDIVRYPIGWNLSVKKVYKDCEDRLYVKECINTKDEYRRFVYESNYTTWDSSLYKELGFGLATDEEIKYLED